METTVSLPTHLHASLHQILNVHTLPDDIRNGLKSRIKPAFEESNTEIPYSLLLRLSQWAQADTGKAAIKEIQLDSADYSLVALLAGTISSPSAKLGAYRRSPSPETKATQRSREKKAISAVINGVLSAIGVGVAAWWSAGSVGWRPEHKVLLAVFSGITVIVAEAILYWIWIWRNEKALAKDTFRQNAAKKNDPPIPPLASGGDAVVAKESTASQPRRRNRLRPT